MTDVQNASCWLRRNDLGWVTVTPALTERLAARRHGTRLRTRVTHPGGRTARGVLGPTCAGAAAVIYAAGLAIGIVVALVAGVATTQGSPALWWLAGYGMAAAALWAVADLPTKRSAA